MPYPDNPADCLKLHAWREGQDYCAREDGVGPCTRCPHQSMCVGSEISRVGNVISDIRKSMQETPRSLTRLAKLKVSTS